MLQQITTVANYCMALVSNLLANFNNWLRARGFTGEIW